MSGTVRTCSFARPEIRALVASARWLRRQFRRRLAVGNDSWTGVRRVYRRRGFNARLRSASQYISWIIGSSADGRAHRKAYRMLKKSPLFDAGWYLRRYADVAEAGIDPLMHYIAHGVRERRDPSPHFRTAGYIALHPALDETTMNPLVHFMIEARRVAASPPGRRDRSGRAFGARNRDRKSVV